MNDSEMLEKVLEEFYPLTKIPRPSGHEKAVSDYLLGYLEKLGVKAVQDAHNNIIADVPASAGLEGAPLTILQSHMDMVCVAAEGVAYDPLRDEIKVVREEEFLRADGTSLGADDGIGIAEILFLLKNMKEHGPMRIIFTVDEESGMTGAIALDKKWFADASYLINCDSENYDILTVGSAGSVNLDFERPISFTETKGGKAYKVSVSGLLGGHSGEEINEGHANAIELLMRVLCSLQEAGVVYEVALAEGGRVRNAIAAEASAVIVSSETKEKLTSIIALAEKHLTSVYGSVDKNLRLTLTESALPDRVFSAQDTAALINLILSLHTGVYAMSQTVKGMVETSANIGVLRTENGQIKVAFFPRSASVERIADFCQSVRALAGLAGFSLKEGTISPAWKEKIGFLAQTMAEIFAAQNGKPMKITSIHAGLECSWHIQKNPSLDMVSIGVTAHDIHSPKERIELKTVVPQVKLIEATLQKIAAAR